MAIVKELLSQVGVTVSYHKIFGVNINYKDKKVVICLASFIDKEKRTSNYKPLEVVDIDVPKEDFKLFEGDNPIGIAYLWLKENVQGFETSSDDLEQVEPADDNKEIEEVIEVLENGE
jgi:hypothetical protein